MKNIFLNLLIVTVLGVLVSCGSKTEGNSDQEATVATSDNQEVEAVKANETVIISAEDFANISDKIARSITKSYLELKDALVTSDSTMAKEAAQKIVKDVEQADAASAIKVMHEYAVGIVESTEMEDMRENFDMISQHVYVMAKAKNPGQTLYKQYCPMAFNNEGAFWLSANEEIRNPYFGDRMLKCGKVQETIGVN